MEAVQTSFPGMLDDVPVENLGSISIRVVVLPPKQKGGGVELEAPLALPLDADDEEMLPEASATPLGSYLESSRGKRCCVFLVNGQRQDFLDNSFIFQDLGFKYLRNRMMIVVDVDGLSVEAIGHLMQGSRQQFFRGGIWKAIMQRIVAALKDDPDLKRLEEEAEEQVSELQAGDEQVKQTLDQLIEAHHESGMHFTEGAGASGEGAGDDQIGLKIERKDGVVSLLPPDKGQAADYPVLFSQPASSTVRLRPNQDREISIKSQPSDAWPALTSFVVDPDSSVPELQVAVERLSDHAKLKLLFREPAGFDADQYPVRAKLQTTAEFNGIKERRQLVLQVLVKPDKTPEEPKLNDIPTRLTVSSREPVRIVRGEVDTHVRFRWDGKDTLLTGPNSLWRLSARVLNGGGSQPTFSFTDANGGRFSLLISPRSEWTTGTSLTFEVTADGPNGARLQVQFAAEVIEPPQKEEEHKPRLVDGTYKVGTKRSPPYRLKYIIRDEYDNVPCWGTTSWTDDDPGCFAVPTSSAPLTLIINKDMAALREYRQYLTKKYTENEVKQRIHKYTSHIAFHLYQMYQATVGKKEDNLDEADARRRDEVKRVAMTLIKLMEVAR